METDILTFDFQETDLAELARLYPPGNQDEPWCEQRSHTDYICTRPEGHGGLHAAYGTDVPWPLALWGEP